jgi:hypothetical protein
MAIIWIEGFEEFGTTLNAAPSPTGVMARKYYNIAAESSFRIVSGRYAGLAVQLTTASCLFGPGGMTTNASLGVGCAVQFSALATYEFLTFYNNTFRGCNLRLTSAGELAVYCTDTLLGTTSGAAIVAGQWYYIEFHIASSSSTGQVHVGVNGVTKLTLTNQNTKGSNANSYHTLFQFKGNASVVLTVDDVYCYDYDNTVFTRTFPFGVQQVATIFPTGAGSSTQWTPSAGSNYACVNETIVDDDTSYVSPSTTSLQDLYAFGSVSNLLSGTPLAIQVNTDPRVTSGSATLYHLCSTNTSSWPLGGRASQGSISGTNYGTYRTVWECNPATDTSWTIGTVNSTNYGVRS